MPSIRRPRSFFKKKAGTTARSGVATSKSFPVDHAPSSPPDPDGSTASHSSHEGYLSNPSSPAATGDPPASVDASDAPPTPMTAAQFAAASDKEMAAKRRLAKDCDTKSRDGVPIITSAGADHFSPSHVSGDHNYATDGFYSKSKKTFGGKERPRVRPSAKCSAFGGAPRYDWMDIETTAAVKIQANYRRMRDQDRLDAAGLSTPGMRNRRAKRDAMRRGRQVAAASADVPFPFNMCGVGLLFGDGTLEDERVVESLEKKRAARAKAKLDREDEEKRRFRMRKKESRHLEEGIEVVESFDATEEEEEEGEERALSSSKSRGRSLRNLTGNARSGRFSLSPSSARSSARSPGGIKSTQRGRSKRLSRRMNEFDPTDDDSL